MQCYACPTTLGPKPFYDKPTGRFYCEVCREIIWDIIVITEPKKVPGDDILPGEVPMLPEEFDFPDELENDDTFPDFSLPAENYNE